MSDTSQGPEWWQANDGKWYPPDAVSADLPSPPKPKQEPLGARGCLQSFLGFVLVVGVVFGAIWAGFAIDHAITGEAHFISRVEEYRPLDSAHLYVSVGVQNTGSKAGVPSCQVEASSPDDSDYGVTTFTGITSVDPSGTLNVNGVVIITNNGAANVSNVTARC